MYSASRKGDRCLVPASWDVRIIRPASMSGTRWAAGNIGDKTSVNMVNTFRSSWSGTDDVYGRDSCPCPIGWQDRQEQLTMFKKDCASSIEVYDCWRGKSSVRPSGRLVTAAGTRPATSGRIAANRSSPLLPVARPHQQAPRPVRLPDVAGGGWVRPALPFPRAAAHGGHKRVSGQQGPFPGAEVREARESTDDHRLHPPVRSRTVEEDSRPHLLRYTPR